METTTCKVVIFLVVRMKLVASNSVSPRMIVGSERGKDPNGLVRAFGGSDNSLVQGSWSFCWLISLAGLDIEMAQEDCCG